MANILSIETSAKTCSVALSRDFTIEFHVESDDGPNHASALGKFVEETMQFARKHDIMPDAVAVSAGPGSYTGLRIGVSEAKGLCFGLGLPLIAVDTLQAMCCRIMFTHDLPEDALFCPMIDARRMEVYTALYNLALQPIRPTSAEIVTPTFLSEELEQHPIYFFGDGSEKCNDIITHPNAHFIPDIRTMATDMLALAVKAYNAQQFEDVAYFVPFYLKDFVATKAKNPLDAINTK